MLHQPQYYRRGQPISAAEALDRNGLLRDGCSVRVSTMLRDSASDTRVRITDGTDDPLAGCRPGWRINASDTAAARAARARCYDEYIHELTTAWRRGAGKEDVGPDAPKVSGNDATPVDDIETAYRLYSEEISQAWRRPR